MTRTPATATDAALAARDTVAARWQALDPLLPEPGQPATNCGADLTVTAADGHVLAAGFCRHIHLKPGSLDLAWSAASQFALTPWVAGPDVREGLGRLLDRWRRHVARQPGAADDDSSATVRWPSRDVAGVRALLAHGLSPLTVIAARPAGRASQETASEETSSLRIRPAAASDLDALERLGMEMMQYDAYFGSVTVRAETARGLRESAERALAAPQPWIWLAERDGQAVGMVQAEAPDLARWVAPLVRAQPVAYLGQMSVLPGARGSGVGAALVGHLHREIDSTEVAVTLLHHAQLNPLSAPFWNRMGYRPLWTLWEVQPAGALL